MPIQGILHDLSKYNPVEFWEGVKYWQGNRSPIDACKEINGYSMAWFHHRGRNLHHYVSWIDNFDETGGTPILMPYKYFAEMVCDFIAAGRAYQGKNFTFQSELLWWKKKREKCKMAPQHILMLDFIFEVLAEKELEYGTQGVDKTFTKLFGKILLPQTYEYFKERTI
jgi:hypothetical protein